MVKKEKKTEAKIFLFKVKNCLSFEAKNINLASSSFVPLLGYVKI